LEHDQIHQEVVEQGNTQERTFEESNGFSCHASFMGALEGTECAGIWKQGFKGTMLIEKIKEEATL
jgi:hypothetical protein